MTAPAVVLVAFVVVPFYLPMLLFAVLGLVPPGTVEVSAAAHGQTFTSHRISDTRTVSDTYARINHLRSSYRGINCGPSADPPTYTYTFRFMRGTILIEVASTTATGECFSPSWEVARGGWQDLRLDFTGAATQAILAEAQLPPPP
jgi:hypothetical protein